MKEESENKTKTANGKKRKNVLNYIGLDLENFKPITVMQEPTECGTLSHTDYDCKFIVCHFLSKLLFIDFKCAVNKCRAPWLKTWL